ncbi:hypothetical protein IQ272_19165 [Chroococcidiopsidales cyanobacterium LEGE 13417]|nr:hypothetical protein [Chroococcidiopsis sp. CCALA 051]MBE9018228.1 hypothetical protein [Chroococcidiopsidales cyanobacterium LEGE 13417]
MAQKILVMRKCDRTWDLWKEGVRSYCLYQFSFDYHIFVGAHSCAPLQI